MARAIERQRAFELRKQGKTYGQIIKLLKVPKSTLSDWLSQYALTEKQLSLLKINKKYSRQLAAEKNRIAKQKKRELRINSVYQKEKKKWKSLTKREIELAGLFLYWGEGTKLMKGPIVISNTDPKVIKFSLYWMIYGLKIPKAKIKVILHLYSDMDIKEEMRYWSRELRLPLSQFSKPYIKKSTRANITYKGYGHGTCGLLTSNVLLKEKIMMAIKAISDNYSSKIEAMI